MNHPGSEQEAQLRIKAGLQMHSQNGTAWYTSTTSCRVYQVLHVRQTKRVFLRKTISRTEFYNKSFEYFTAKLWNSLPSPIITLTDIGPFTRARPHGDIIFITEGGGRACNCQKAESPMCTKNRTHLPTSSQFHNLRPHVHLALVQTLYHR